MPEIPAGSPDVASRMDHLPVTAMHVLAVGLCGLGMIFDTFEISFGIVLATVFSTPPHVAKTGQLSLLLAAVFIGAIVGAPSLGWLADRRGRRNALVVVLLWLAATSLAAAASNSMEALTVFRGLSGLALGAYPPIVIAYMTDLLPPRRRGTLIFVGLSLATLGPPAGVFLVRWLTPLQPWGMEAWRWGLAVGGVGAGIVGILFRAIPESPRWLQARGYAAAADAACRKFQQSRVVARIAATDIESPRAAHADEGGGLVSARRRWSLVGALFLLSPWATVTFPMLLGAVLTQKGFKLSDTLLYVGLGTFGPLIGTVLASTVVDRIERRMALAICATAMMASGLWFVMSNVPASLVAASSIFTLFLSLYVPVLNVYGAELFPTRLRASSIAGAWALNRVGAALAPLLLVPVLRQVGPLPMFGLIAATLLLSMLVLIIAPAGRQRLPVT